MSSFLEVRSLTDSPHTAQCCQLLQQMFGCDRGGVPAGQTSRPTFKSPRSNCCFTFLELPPSSLEGRSDSFKPESFAPLASPDSSPLLRLCPCSPFCALFKTQHLNGIDRGRYNSPWNLTCSKCDSGFMARIPAFSRRAKVSERCFSFALGHWHTQLIVCIQTCLAYSRADSGEKLLWTPLTGRRST